MELTFIFLVYYFFVFQKWLESLQNVFFSQIAFNYNFQAFSRLYSMPKTYEDLIYMAKICEQVEAFDDMTKYIKKAATLHKVFRNEERNLLHVAYKNVVAPIRSTLRLLSSIQSKKESKNAQFFHLIADYKLKLEGQLNEYGHELIYLIDHHILPFLPTDAEAIVFYFKMKGDYYRYMLESTRLSEHSKCLDKALFAYEEGYRIAKRSLPPNHHERLCLGFNFSILHYEALGNTKKAAEIARSAFNDAFAEIESQQDDDYCKNAEIMLTIRDSVTLWENEFSSDDDDDDEDEDENIQIYGYEFKQQLI